jgi:hypothetical protein
VPVILQSEKQSAAWVRVGRRVRRMEVVARVLRKFKETIVDGLMKWRESLVFDFVEIGVLLCLSGCRGCEADKRREWEMGRVGRKKHRMAQSYIFLTSLNGW